MKILLRSHEKGIALIIVMVTIFVLAMLAGGFALSMKVETKLARNANSESTLEWMGRSGVEYCAWVLALQLECGGEAYDSLNQPWAGGDYYGPCTNAAILQTIHMNGGTISWKITDLERKFNINTDALSGAPIMEQAFISMGVDAGEYPAVMAAVRDWVDADNDPHMGGAESDYYQGAEPPLVAKNGPIDDMSELLLIKGITPEIFYGSSSTEHSQAAFQHRQGFFDSSPPPNYAFGLNDVFTPISSGRVNINTASETVLQLIPGLDPIIVPDIIKLRSGPDGVDGNFDDTPFRSVGELVNVGIGNQSAGQMNRFLTVRSSMFEVEVEAEINNYKAKYFAIIARNNRKDVQILSFRRKTL